MRDRWMEVGRERSGPVSNLSPSRALALSPILPSPLGTRTSEVRKSPDPLHSFLTD